MTAQTSGEIGQITEWLVWAALMAHSRHTTHLFLPLQDRGVDGILRRPADDAMVALQVKGSTQHGTFHAIVHETSLETPGIQFVLAGVDSSAPSLLDPVVVCDGHAVRDLGLPVTTTWKGQGREISFPTPPNDGDRWHRFTHSPKSMADVILGPLTMETTSTPTKPETPEAHKASLWMGGLAEVETMRLLSAVPDINVFKSFPDLELVEYIARDWQTGAMCGIQVKCVGLASSEDAGAFSVSKKDLSVPTSAMVVVLGWRQDVRDFDSRALFFPASSMPQLGYDDDSRWQGYFHPAGDRQGRFDHVRVLRSEIGARVLERLRSLPANSIGRDPGDPAGGR